MTRVLVAAVSAALLIGAVVSPANAEHGGGGFHGGAAVFHGGGHGGAGVFHGGGGIHGGEHFHEAFRGGGFHKGFHGERFHDHDHDHDHFRGPVIVGGLALGLGLGAVGGALLPPPAAHDGPSPVCYPPPPASPPPPAGYCYGPDGLLYAL
jgi:hypothetical protein